jgi:hypothetical protein
LLLKHKTLLLDKFRKYEGVDGRVLLEAALPVLREVVTPQLASDADIRRMLAIGL